MIYFYLCCHSFFFSSGGVITLTFSLVCPIEGFCNGRQFGFLHLVHLLKVTYLFFKIWTYDSLLVFPIFCSAALCKKKMIYFEFTFFCLVFNFLFAFFMELFFSSSFCHSFHSPCSVLHRLLSFSPGLLSLCTASAVSVLVQNVRIVTLALGDDVIK